MSVSLVIWNRSQQSVRHILQKSFDKSTELLQIVDVC